MSRLRGNQELPKHMCAACAHVLGRMIEAIGPLRAVLLSAEGQLAGPITELAAPGDDGTLSSSLISEVASAVAGLSKPILPVSERDRTERKLARRDPKLDRPVRS